MAPWLGLCQGLVGDLDGQGDPGFMLHCAEVLQRGRSPQLGTCTFLSHDLLLLTPHRWPDLQLPHCLTGIVVVQWLSESDYLRPHGLQLHGFPVMPLPELSQTHG